MVKFQLAPSLPSSLSPPLLLSLSRPHSCSRHQVPGLLWLCYLQNTLSHRHIDWTMAWVHIVLLTLLPTILILTVLSEVEGAAVKDVKDNEPKGTTKRVFVPASDASNFFKRRGRRSPTTQAEYYAEQKVQLAASERRREYYEEQSSEYENHVEEARDGIYLT
ncbi:hypothetical protein NFI96_011867 [Prochilodus magdalenae]|nr:hypothetical protein NFI96_011867 [Prochilodus magdalenae]